MRYLFGWLSRLLLRLLPRDFRRRYGDEVADYFLERSREIRSANGWSGVALFWIRGVADVGRVAIAELHDSLAALRGGSRLAGKNGGSIFGALLQDVKYAFRTLRRTPRFTSVAVLVLTLGIGATTAIFSVVSCVVLRPLPFPESNRLVKLYETTSIGDRYGFSGANFLDVQIQAGTFDGLAGHTSVSLNLVGGEHPIRLLGESVTPNFFSVLGANALLGRTFSPEVDVPHGGRAAVLSYASWQTQFAGDSEILGRDLQLNGTTFTVVGVMPPDFRFPEDAQLWVTPASRVPDPPYDLGRDPAENRGIRFIRVFGRLRDGVTHDDAQCELVLIGRRLAGSFPEYNHGGGLVSVPLHDAIVGSVRAPLYLILGAVGMLLLISCANVASLFLARAIGRDREIATRTALGASRLRISRQLVTEGVALSFLGGTLGIAAARWGTKLVVSLAPGDTPRLVEVSTDLGIMSLGVAVSCVTGMLFGLAPALQFARRTGSPIVVGASTRSATTGRGGLRSLLVTCEVAVSFVLMVAALVTVATLRNVLQVDPGFEINRVLTVDISLPEAAYQKESDIVNFYRDVLERVRTIPGVQSAGAIHNLPMGGRSSHYGFSVEGRATESSDEVRVGYQVADTDYFNTLGIPLMRGRVFTDADDIRSPPVALVNETLAERFWPDLDPIGQRVTWGDPESEDADWVAIVGIVGDTRHNGLDRRSMPEIYRPYVQAPMPRMTVVVRSGMSEAGQVTALRQSVMDVDAGQALFGARTMERVVSESLASHRFIMRLVGLFAVFALVLSAVGLYGVVSFAVAQRFREIGIRIAVGARSGQVLSLIVRQGARLLALGLAVGGIGAISLNRLMASVVYGVRATDPLILGAGVFLLAATGLVACVVPARRASRIDPVTTLRSD